MTKAMSSLAIIHRKRPSPPLPSLLIKDEEAQERIPRH